LFATGYTRNAVVHNGTIDPDVELIMKPFSLDVAGAKGRPHAARRQGGGAVAPPGLGAGAVADAAL